MKKSYFFFKKSTGQCVCRFSGNEHDAEMNIGLYPDCEKIEGSGGIEHVWVNLSDKSVQTKIDNPATLSGTTISNLPLPCTVTMRGPTSAEAYVEQDGLTLDADVPGRYRVTVVADHPKYYDAEFEVDL